MIMKKHPLLLLDAIINLLLGVLLMIFPRPLVDFLGMPSAINAFYPSLLGAVLFGIGIALLLHQYLPKIGGLGLGGAVSINLCGGMVLTYWLLMGGLELPTRGFVFLWVIVLILMILSVMELHSSLRSSRQ